MSLMRKSLIALVILLIILIAGVGLLVLSLEPESVRERLETQLTAATGFQVTAEGGVELEILPPGISLAGVVLRAGTNDVLTASRIKAGIALLPLLRGDLHLSNLTFEEPALSIPPDGLNGWPSGSTSRSATAMTVDGVSIRNGSLRYTDEASGIEVKLDGLDLKIDEIDRDETGRLSLVGDFHAARLRLGRIELTDLDGPLSGQGNTYRVEALDGRLYGSAVEGHLNIDLEGAHPAWTLHLEAPNLSLTELFDSLAGRPVFEGSLLLQADLRGGGSGRFLNSLRGSVRMAGTDLLQHGFDLDGTIGNFRESRSLVDLTDIGFFVFAGPVGLLVSKSTDAAGLLWNGQTENRQVIEEFVFNWRLDQGLARVEDVALRTPENRLAIKGTIDLSAMRYKNMTLALLNAEGCAELTERISGPVTQPVVEKTGVLGSLAGSLVGVVRQGLDIFDFRDCTPFYQGKVAHRFNPDDTD